MSEHTPIPSRSRPQGIAIGFGAVVWLVAALVVRPEPRSLPWGQLMLMLAPLVLVPLGLSLVEPPADRRAARLWHAALALRLLGALLLGAAYLEEQGPTAGALSLPWLLVTATLAVVGVVRLGTARSFGDVSVAAALILVLVGGCWATADRFGLRPLGFKPEIVFLTGIHFHYAGFVLPLVTGLAARRHDDALSRAAVVGVLASVPAVAVGITTTQLGGPGVIEALSAWAMAVAGVMAAAVQVRAGWRAGGAGGVLVVLAGACLAAGMVLAALYGGRSYLPVAWLDIPWMRALHGTANALGFALAALAGWALIGRRAVAPAPPGG